MKSHEYIMNRVKAANPNYRQLTTQEETELGLRCMQGDIEAQHAMVDANLPLAIQIAMDYSGTKHDPDDVISEAITGLMEVVGIGRPDGKGVFNPTLGKFSTFAGWYIRKYVRAYTAEDSTVSISRHSFSKRCAILAARERLQDKLGSEPSIALVAAESGFSENMVTSNLESCVNRVSICQEDDMEEDGHGMGPSRFPCAAPTPDNEVNTSDVTTLIQWAISKLDSREATIIKERFGMVDGIEKTLEEIGAKHNLTRERIRQIERSAKRKLMDLLKSREPEIIGELAFT